MITVLRREAADASRRALCADLDRIAAYLNSDRVSDDHVVAARNGLDGAQPIQLLEDTFGLTGFERDVILLGAAVEMDSAVASRCAELQGGGNRRYATFGIALGLLPEPHWSAVAPGRPLRSWRLIEVDDGDGLIDGRLQIDERILHFLAGTNELDVRLRPLVRDHRPAALFASSHAQIAASVATALATSRGSRPCIQLSGNDPAGQEDVAAAIATHLGLRLHVLHAEDLPAGAYELDGLSMLLSREATLLPSALLVVVGDNSADRAARLIGRLHGLALTSSAGPFDLAGTVWRETVGRPPPAEQRDLWRSVLGLDADAVNGALDAVAAQFSLSARTIGATGADVGRSFSVGADPGALLWRACRRLSRTRLDDLAQRIAPSASWDTLVLPEPQLATLRQIVMQVRNRLHVHEAWGFAQRSTRGLGISALFSGDSGTGKTMAAEVLAADLNLDLYRIDLSALVSKYIGETEKNLRQVFDVAEHSGAILLFDEADALFGKRSDVRDSHDRFANIEVSYLLQRMESYRGLAILTTNAKSALDKSFHRRLRFVVQFPFPDTGQREAIWRSVFPEATPVRSLDYRRLARLQASGGDIRNIALNAAFLAADANEPVRMAHLLDAARGEAAKRERPLPETATRGWA